MRMPWREEHRKAVRENRMHGLMREGRRKPVLYSTYWLLLAFAQITTISRPLLKTLGPPPPWPRVLHPASGLLPPASGQKA